MDAKSDIYFLNLFIANAGVHSPAHAADHALTLSRIHSGTLYNVRTLCKMVCEGVFVAVALSFAVNAMIFQNSISAPLVFVSGWRVILPRIMTLGLRTVPINWYIPNMAIHKTNHVFCVIRSVGTGIS